MQTAKDNDKKIYVNHILEFWEWQFSSMASGSGWRM